jgi:hypothetical protein
MQVGQGQLAVSISSTIVPAQYQTLCRAIEALEAEGIRFSDGGGICSAPRRLGAAPSFTAREPQHEH